MPAASLIGFPTLIEVTCGEAWQGLIPDANPIQPDDVIILGQVSANAWSENRVNIIPDPNTNRLMLQFTASKFGITLQATANVYAATYTSGPVHPILSFYQLGEADRSTVVGPGGGYNFLSIWSATGPNNYWRDTWINNTAQFNPNVFSLMREYVSDSIGIGQAHRLLMGVG